MTARASERDYERAVALYKAGTPIASVAEQVNRSKAWVYTVLYRAGVPRTRKPGPKTPREVVRVRIGLEQLREQRIAAGLRA